MKISKYEPRIEVHHSLIVYNLNQMKTRLKDSVKIMAVVKSNAYGHGIEEVVKTLEMHVDSFGVGYLNEAFNCCELTKKDIFIMGPVYDFDLVKRSQFVLTVENSLQFQCLVNYIKMEKEAFRIHFKVDTGMSRFGLSHDELKVCLETIKQLQLETFIKVEGMYSHFATTVLQNEKSIQSQYQLFCEMKKVIEVYYPREQLTYHIANSENAVENTSYQEDMVRLGNGLYGPLALKKSLSLKRVSRVLLPILSIHEKHESSRVGYGLKRRIKKGSKIGIIQVGFYDGFGLMKSPAGQSLRFIIMDYTKKIIKSIIKPEMVFLGEEAFPVIGAINMQFFQIDMTHSHVMIGDFVEIKQAPLYFKVAVKRLHIREENHEINS